MRLHTNEELTRYRITSRMNSNLMDSFISVQNVPNCDQGATRRKPGGSIGNESYLDIAQLRWMVQVKLARRTRYSPRTPVQIFSREQHFPSFLRRPALNSSSAFSLGNGHASVGLGPLSFEFTACRYCTSSIASCSSSIPIPSPRDVGCCLSLIKYAV